MSKNLLIVESHNDKFFLERLRNAQSSESDNQKDLIKIEYRCLDGIDNLKNELKTLKREIGKDGFTKIGIIADADKLGIEERLNLINLDLKNITSDLEISNPNIWYKSETLNAEFSCHVVNIDGFGELENLLKEIKTKPSMYADCLIAWRKCLEDCFKKNNQPITDKEPISDKEFFKFWVSVYGRYDCCSKKEKNRAGKNCNEEISISEKEIWNFSHPILTDLKSYLTKFG